MFGQTLKWINKSVGKIRLVYISVIIASAIQSAFAVGFALSVKDLINCVTGSSASIDSLFYNACITTGLAVCAYILSAVDKVLIEKCRITAEINIKNRVFGRLLKKDYADTAKFQTGDLVNRIVNDSAIVARGYAVIVPSIVAMSTKIIFAVGVLVILQPVFTLILLVSGVAICAFSFVVRRLFKRLHKATRTAESAVMSYYSESASNLLAVKVFSAEETVAKKGAAILSKYEGAAKKQRYLSATLTTVFSFSFVLFYILTIIWGAVGLYNQVEGIDFGVIVSMIQLVAQLQAPFANFTAVFAVYYEMLASAERIIEIESLKNDDYPEQSVGGDKFYKEMIAIKAEKLSFSYGRESVFESVDFEIKKGDKALIKGVSGAGKSTLLKLILGVYKDFEGELYFASKSGRFDIYSQRRNMFAYVPQGNLLFSGTVKENICFLCEEATDVEIQKAIEIACLDFINDFPDGINTVIGEDGRGLSEGQGQRVAIARAILGKRPILLLDEAMSALDNKTELTVLDRLNKHAIDNGLTLILISHKPDTLKICNNIITVENGRVTSERESAF